MNSRHLITIPLATIAALAVAGVAEAHDGWATGTCQGGVSWSYSNYEKADVNSITVTIDGTVRYHDGDFKASDTGTIATDKTVGHTWDVLVNAPGSNFDRSPSGSYGACVVAPTTTVQATTTTVAVTTTVPATTVPATTTPEAPTTTLVAVDLPPVPCQYNPAVPAGSPLCTPPAPIDGGSAIVPGEPHLPATGAGDTAALIALAVAMIGTGWYLARKGRRVQ